jgi:hypothetical protein
VWLLNCTGDSSDRTVASALCAAFALLRIDLVVQESLADACRTSLLYDMSFILISEVLEG